MIHDFIVATATSGDKVLVQVHNIFAITETKDCVKIQSIGAPGNSVEVKESLATIIEKIDKKK